MKKEDSMSNLTKAVIYGGNFVAGAIGKSIDYKIGNPMGAIVYGGLDIARHSIPTNKYIRLTELVGTGIYAGKTILDLVNILKGNWESMIQLPFDAGMLYEIGKNTAEDYKASKSNLGRDVIGVRDNIFVDTPNFWRKLTGGKSEPVKGLKKNIK